MENLYDPSGGSNVVGDTVPQEIQELRALVGNAVFVPCNLKKGGKGPIIKGWQKLALEQMTEEHIRQCESPEYRLGVVFGHNSGGLVGLDCDEDIFADEMQRRNPWLANTLTTTCNRGRTFWLRITDCWPRNGNLWLNGVKVGEWRADRNQSVIAGQDTETKNWRRFVRRAPALAIPFSVLVWPEGLEKGGDKTRHPWPPAQGAEGEWEDASPLPPAASSCSEDVEQGCRTRTRSTSSCSTSARSTSADEMQLKQKRLYRTLVEHLSATEGTRNAMLNQSVNYLIHTLAESLVIEFLLRHYDEKGKPGGWRETRVEHEKSVRNLVEGCVRDYPAKLSEAERTIYLSLRDETERTTFRICRDLAARDDPKLECPPGLFLLAYGELAARLNSTNRIAERVLKYRFKGELEIAAIVTPGTRRSKGTAGRSTRWRWLLT